MLINFSKGKRKQSKKNDFVIAFQVITFTGFFGDDNDDGSGTG